MDIVFTTTNKRKIEDLQNVIKNNNLDINVLCLSDINWDRGEILEIGSTLEEISFIKAKCVFDFCRDKKLNYVILADDAGLFVKKLNGEPGIYTGRYADDELELNQDLPKYQCLYKLLKNMENIKDRDAYYKCVITCMFSDGTYYQESEITEGVISKEVNEPIKRPYFYSLFLVNNKPFNMLNSNELKETYRYKALEKTLKRLK